MSAVVVIGEQRAIFVKNDNLSVADPYTLHPARRHIANRPDLNPSSHFQYPHSALLSNRRQAYPQNQRFSLDTPPDQQAPQRL